MLNNEATWSVFQVFTSITHPYPHPLKNQRKERRSCNQKNKILFVDFQTLGDYTMPSSFEETKNQKRRMCVKGRVCVRVWEG